MRIENLSIGFFHSNAFKTALKPMSFQVQKGKTFALIGESGSGKTLSALSILQLLPNNAQIVSGAIFLNQHNLLDFNHRQMQQIRGRKIAMIFQEPNAALNPVLNIQTQLEEVLNAHFVFNASEKKRRIAQILENVGLNHIPNILKKYPFELSGGMKQRVMIAAALLGEPDFLIADEPTTALDVTVQAQILALIKTIQEKTQMGILLITHDLGVVAQMADDVGVLYQGQLLEVASKKAFFQHPQNAYSQHLISRAQVPNKIQKSTVNEKIILKIKHFNVEYPIYKGIFKRQVGKVCAVHNVAFNLKQGKTLALVGESGSGKSSLGKALMRLIAFQGEIETFENARLQMIFQDPFGAFNPRWNVEKILQEGLKAQGKKASKQELLQWLNRVGLPDVLNRYPHEFSGGQRQRLAIARALLVQPQILILDEPTSALDLNIQAQILTLLEELQQQHNLTYLFITHNFSVVRQMADEIAVLYLGHLVEWGSAKEILNHPKHPYTQLLLNSVPQLSDQAPRDWSLAKALPMENVQAACPFYARCPKATNICAEKIPMMIHQKNQHFACHLL